MRGLLIALIALIAGAVRVAVIFGIGDVTPAREPYQPLAQ